MKETETAWSKGGPNFNSRPSNSSTPKPQPFIQRKPSTLKFTSNTVETELEALQPIAKKSDPSVFDVVENAKSKSKDQPFNTSFKDKIISSPRQQKTSLSFNDQKMDMKKTFPKNTKRFGNQQGEKKASSLLRSKEINPSQHLNRISKLNLNDRERNRSSAFRDKSREDRTERKKKFDEIAKQKIRYDSESLMEIKKVADLSGIAERVLTELEPLDFDGLFQEEGETLLAIEEEFDTKVFLAELQEEIKKDRAEKTRKFEARQLNTKPANPWRRSPRIEPVEAEPLWSTEDAQDQPMDLADLASRTQKMTEKPLKEEEIGLEEMASMSQKFCQEMKEKNGRREESLEPKEEIEYTEEEPHQLEQRQSVEAIDFQLEREKQKLQQEFFRPTPRQQYEEMDFNMNLYERQQMEARESERRRREEYYLQQQQQEMARRKQQQWEYEQWRQQQQQQQVGPRWIQGSWWYKDPQGASHGPYSSKQMRTWLDCKYLDESLLITRHAANNSYHPLKQYFPNPSTSFLEPPRSMNISQPRPFPHQMQPQNQMVPRERYERQVMRSAEPNVFDFNNLKKEENFLELNTREEPKKETMEKKEEIESLNLDQKKMENKTESLKKMLGLQKEQPSPRPPSPKAKSNPWNKPKVEESASSVSLRQIQQEQTDMLKQSIESGTYQAPQPKMWASLVANNSGPQAPSLMRHPQSHPVVERKQGSARDQILKWCEAQCLQLRSMKKPQDSTSFFEFCLNLETAAQVRDCFRENLGTSPEVSKFATQFLNFKARVQK